MLARLGFVLFFLLGYNANGQTPNLRSNIVGRINISSPNASSIGKFSDIPVSYHTGTPSISVPLHEVKSGAVSIPIGLSYHAGGIKVEETASWVGLGWNLNAGGVITRVVRDKPDERQAASTAEQHGYFSDYGFTTTLANTGTGSTTAPTDFEPDLFTFSFPGGSGKFVFDEDRTPVLFPHQDIKIEYTYTSGTSAGIYGTINGNMGRCIERFIITTPDGIRYHFGMLPVSPSSPFVHPIEISHNYSCISGGMPMANVITSWYLYRIESANGEDVVELMYERDRYSNYTHTTSMGAINNFFHESSTPNNCNRIAPIKLFNFGVRLTRITAPLERIDFLPGLGREDLSRWNAGDIEQALTDYGSSSSPSLGAITVNDPAGGCIKRFNFTYDYFVDNTTQVNSSFSGINTDKKRLRLLSVQESTCDGLQTIPAHTFEYFSDFLPRRLSFARDHWGYNNGAVGNMELFPELSDNRGLGRINTERGLSINDRNSKWPEMRAGALKKIVYPTGGSSEFEFEPHSVVLNSGSGQVGGLRIKKITVFDPVTSQSMATNYTYQLANGSTTSGVLFGRPVYVQIVRNDHSAAIRTGGFGHGCHLNSILPGGDSLRHYVVSDASLRPMESTQGYHVGYSRVIEEQTGNGRKVFHYDVNVGQSGQPVSPPSSVAQVFINNPAACDAGIPNFPAAPLPFAPNRGKLLREENFDQAGQKLTEKEFSYLNQDMGFRVPGYIMYSVGGASAGELGILATFYELRTSRVTALQTVERRFQAGQSPIEVTQQSFFESIRHSNATRVQQFDAKGQLVEKRLTYAYDLRTASMNAITNCSTNGSNAYLDRYTALLISGGFQSQLLACGGDANCRTTVLNSFLYQLANSRKGYVDCRRVNYTNTVAHGGSLSNAAVALNSSIAAADAVLKPVLMMQRYGRNPLIEESNWLAGRLTHSAYNQYINDRGDDKGIHPHKQFVIEPSSLGTSFSGVGVAANNQTITRDGRYSELATSLFHRGNPVNIAERGGVIQSYEWSPDYSLPIATVNNARGERREQFIPGTVTTAYSGSIGGSSGGSFSRSQTISQTELSSMTFSVPANLPPNARVSVQVLITGAASYSFMLCTTSNSGSLPCSGVPSSVTLASVPAGTYTVQVTASTQFSSFPFAFEVSHTYRGSVLGMAGDKEFYINTFEYDNGANVISGNAHSGNRFLNASFTESPVLPAGKSYVAQWWRQVGGKWQFNSTAYNAGQVLPGPVDNVRIFPVDAQLKTYTYTRDGRVTSETDLSGRTLFYLYDAFGRLACIRNEDQYIVKRFCYTYAGQTENCVVSNSAVWVSNGVERCKPCSTNASFVMNVRQLEEIDINPNSPTYNQKRWVDLGPSSSCEVVSWQNIGSQFCELNASGQNTGNVLQQQRDMNPCSITFNQTRNVLIGFNAGTCPLPASCNTSNCQGDDWKCVGGQCEQGFKVYTHSTFDSWLGMWVCTFHYEWSDGSWSQSYTEHTYDNCSII